MEEKLGEALMLACVNALRPKIESYLKTPQKLAVALALAMRYHAAL